MLSILRNATRTLSVPRSSLAASYSQQHNMEGLVQLVSDVGVQHDTERTKLNEYNSAMPLRRAKFRAFAPGHPATLKMFSYKYASKAPKEYRTKKSVVGPSPSVARPNDLFHQFSLDPVKLVTNPKILSNYVSEMGKIYGRNVTGLTSKSQRRVGKAIRRAKMMGIIPVLSR